MTQTEGFKETCTRYDVGGSTSRNKLRIDGHRILATELSDENRLFKVISIFAPRFQID